MISCNRITCVQKRITHGDKYFNVGDDMGERAYFIFDGSEKVDYVDGKIVARSKVHWGNCTDYSLVIKMLDSQDLLQVGDTFNVSIKSFSNDTFHYVLNWKGREVRAAFYKAM